MNTIDEVNKEIEKRNKIFSKASPAQKRVLIAKDALAQIKAKRFIPESGNFLDVHYTDADAYDKSFQQEFFKNEHVKCTGCALGALFVSTTLLANKATVENMIDENDIGDRIRLAGTFTNEFNKHFSGKQLALIEFTFEGGSGSFGWTSIKRHGVSDIILDRAADFYNNYKGRENKLLIAILKNIIKNKGQFKP